MIVVEKDIINHCGKNYISDYLFSIKKFYQYFSQFNTKKVLIITDEDVASDLRVQNQISAFYSLTNDITVFRVQTKNSYTIHQRIWLKYRLAIEMVKKIQLLPNFVLLSKKLNSSLALRQKTKQGIYNDNSHWLFEGIDTSEYTLVVCNNLISASAIKFSPNVDYVYDIHELEIFRNRNHQSIERSFYVYLQEGKALRRIKNLITISKKNAELLSQIHNISADGIECIYNQNFPKKYAELSSSSITHCLYVYIGRVAKDRGLDDVVALTKRQKVLVIACNYSDSAIDYLLDKSHADNIVLFKGMDYHKFLYEQLKQYSQVFFLALITPNSVSYRNALPNKFFQAQALGLPIVAYDNTYLADIIRTYHCGIIFNPSTDKEWPSIDNNAYSHMRSAMMYDIAVAIKNQQL